MSDKLKEATIALLDKMDELDSALTNAFLLASIHGHKYVGSNWVEEYDRCRRLTGTKKKEVS